MPTIFLMTAIKASAELCFDLSRSIDLHMVSAEKTGEKAISGRTKGLISAGETVTWRARHFGVWQNLTVKIITMNPPVFFEDEMEKGAFKSFRHEHHFEQKDGTTILKDVFVFESPFGLLGKMANTLFLTNYMKGFLTERNSVIKEYAESGKWREILYK